MESTLKSALGQYLSRYGQSHLLRFWDELDAGQQADLAAQIESLDLELIQSLVASKADDQRWHDLAQRAEVPSAITLADAADPGIRGAAVATGRDALAAGHLAMVLVAGGQGSRLGFDDPKGMYPIGPISGASLYQIHFEKVLARSRQFGAPIPMYVMTSPPTHEATSNYLRQHDYFGMDPTHVRIFCQGVMPAVDDEGKLLLASRNQVFFSPDGHGGTLAGLVKSGCLAHARSLGVRHLFYGQVDNPLIQTCDPALVGYHINHGSEMTSQVVRKTDPLQRVGNVVDVDGRVQIIEYSDLPEAAARQVDPEGRLKLWAGSIAVHIFNLDFLERCSTRAETLPYHRAKKAVPFLDETGNLVQPAVPNATKFERFIFDLLPFASNAIVCEVDPADGFCALKNAAGAAAETEAHVQAAILELHRRWLEQAGVRVAEDARVELSPLFAVDQAVLQERFSESVEIQRDRYFHQQ